jgi:hypothetical protein
MRRINTYPSGLDTLQKLSVSLMGVLVVLTFVGANLHALLWQQSAWLVSTVLPAVVVDLTNDERVRQNAPVLQRNPSLDEAARLKAEHMAANEYFSHYSPDGVSPWYWFKEAGYHYAHAGENLAIHFTDSTAVVDAWMRSPAHRANIVDARYAEIGVGTAKGSYEGFDTVFVVQLFGTPAIPTAPIEQTPTVQLAVPEAATEEAQLAEIAETVGVLSETVAALTNIETPTNSIDMTVTAADSLLPAPSRTEPAIGTIIEEAVIDDSDSAVVPTEHLPKPAPVSAGSVATDGTSTADVVVVESTIATSSGLAIASLTAAPEHQPAGSTLLAFVTQPNEVLQFVYMVLAMLVLTLLLLSAVFEARQLHFVRVGYSMALMVSMGALWYVHALLTAGAVIA